MKLILVDKCIACVKRMHLAFVIMFSMLMVPIWSQAQVPGSAYTIFQTTDVPATPLDNDNNGMGLVVGLKFKAAKNGNIYGVRFYKGTGAADGQVGSIWTTTGSLLTTVAFTSQTSSGWQEALFAEPLAITANTTYVVSCFSPSGDFAYTELYFDSDPKVTHDLEAPEHGSADGYNGVYKYDTVSSFPDQGSNASNYFVDIVFDTTAIGDKTNYVAKYISPTVFGKSIIYDNGTNVGIGTTDINSGDHRLYVETGIRTRKVKVDQANWPDYVFDEKYRLPSITEIEAFIHQNRHLPEIPSAREVEEKGLDLGDQQARLLKKIEEMTLYIINMHKEIESLRRETEELKMQIRKAGK